MELTNEYIRGLVDGEGCFCFHTRGKSKNGNKSKMPAFVISMHERDKELLESVKDHLKLRNKVYVYKPYLEDGYKRGRKAVLAIREIGQLKNIIIPFFYKRLRGYKGKQFVVWLDNIGNDPNVGESYKLLYRLYINGFYDKNPRFLD